MKNAIIQTKNKYPDYSVWITGHSLGAALASVAAAKIAFLNYFPPEKMLLMTFGQPRTGTIQYAKFVDSKIPNAYRVVHRYDWVPQMPPEILYGYFHHATEIWYNNDMKIGDPFKVCKGDEDLSCSETSGHLNGDVS
uniref:Fungal lipase-like domain-containing protein n=1 Tax=Panagrolaimus sp. JU765 TaxID=591449 RepID=A0AC34RLW5_9BILA